MADFEDLTVRATMQDDLSGDVARATGELRAMGQAMDEVSEEATELSATTSRAASSTSAQGAAATRTAAANRTLATSTAAANASIAGTSKASKVGTAALLGLKLALVGTVAGVAALAATSVSTASAVGESVNKSRVIYGKHSAEVEKWATSIAASHGIAEGAALDASAGFGNFFQQAGKTKDAAADMAQTLVERAGDLSSFFDAASPEVLANLQSGLSGEAEPMRKYAVFLNEAKVQAEAVSAGIAKQGEALTDEQKILARYNIILEKSTHANKDFAETVGTSLANSVRATKAEFSNLTGEMGEKLLPQVLKVVTAVREVMGPALKAMEPALNAMTGALAQVLPPLIKGFAPVLGVIGEVLAEVMKALGPVIGVIGKALTRALRVVLPVLKPLIRELGDGLLRVIRSIAPILPDLAKAFVQLLRAATPLIEPITRLAVRLVKLLTPGLTRFLREFAGLMRDLRGPIKTVVEWLNEAIDVVFDFGERVRGALTDLPDWAKGLLGNIPGASFVLNAVEGREKGGPMNAGQPYIVGERGPEVVVPDRRGLHVVPGSYAGETRQRQVLEAAGYDAEGISGEGLTVMGPLIGELHATDNVDVRVAVRQAIRDVQRDKKERRARGGAAA